jgi:hypothetical protein
MPKMKYSYTISITLAKAYNNFKSSHNLIAHPQAKIDRYGLEELQGPYTCGLFKVIAVESISKKELVEAMEACKKDLDSNDISRTEWLNAMEAIK